MVSDVANYHAPNYRPLLLCKPLYACRGVWIGAGNTVLPGVTVGEYAYGRRGQRSHKGCAALCSGGM